MDVSDTGLSRARRAGRPIGVALLGGGVVGQGVVRLLSSREGELAARLGRPLVLRGVAVRDVSKDRGLAEGLATGDALALAIDPGVDIVVEAISDAESAYQLLLAAIRAGKHVVTANKEALARHGRELFDAARLAGVQIGFEAAVCGGIPLIMPLDRGLIGNELTAVYGIVNGTTNYILTRMSEEQAPFHQVLREAQELGYAEADPTSDIDGHDAAYKVAILAELLCRQGVPIDRVATEGIRELQPIDLRYARELGYAVKLLAVARKHRTRLEVHVRPTMIPLSHPLAAIRLVTNAVAVKGDAVGEVMFSGPGAGQLPTASSVLTDIVAMAERLDGCKSFYPPFQGDEADVVPLEETTSRFYLRLIADDKPGVLGALGTRFGTHGVSIRYFVQKEAQDGKAELVFVTHPVQEGKFRDAIGKIGGHAAIRKIEAIISVEDDV